MDHYLLFYDIVDDYVARRAEHRDPYVVHGLVTAWSVRRWTTVVGEGCATPVRPGGPPS